MEQLLTLCASIIEATITPDFVNLTPSIHAISDSVDGKVFIDNKDALLTVINTKKGMYVETVIYQGNNSFKAFSKVFISKGSSSVATQNKCNFVLESETTAIALKRTFSPIRVAANSNSLNSTRYPCTFTRSLSS